jgi:homospermidine synthase
MDELGVLLMGHAKGAYWYGSRLTIAEARASRRTTAPPRCR